MLKMAIKMVCVIVYVITYICSREVYQLWRQRNQSSFSWNNSRVSDKDFFSSYVVYVIWCWRCSWALGTYQMCTQTLKVL